MLSRCILLVVSVVFFPFYSQFISAKSILDNPRLERLSLHPRWLKLMHYKITEETHKSLVSDERFFFSSMGKVSPKDELLANLKIFQKNTIEAQEARCRFPARIKFLEEQLNIKLKLANDNCDEFAQWQQENLVDEVWLVFPSAYLNSPSSMFGHTLLRLDKHQEEGTVLTSNAVNYAANIDEQENGIIYAFKGLFGGYPGYFSMMPYYKKVKEYSRMENRDIWEYKLNLTEQEIEWLVLHLWELDQMQFDYYFTTQNCSYQLLTLLEVVRPNQKLTEPFELVAIPVDTVRELEKQNWITDSVFRPSQATEFYQSVQPLTSDQKALISSIKELSLEEFTEQLAEYNNDEKIAITNYAYQLLRLNKGTRDQNKKALQILSLRSHLGAASHTTSASYQDYSSPEKGHESTRFTIGMTTTEDKSGLLLDYKVTYHGLDDPVEGYAKGAQINFFHTQATIFDEKIQLDQLDILDIRSLSISDQFINRLAWQVNLGFRRSLFSDQKYDLSKQLNSQFGKVYKLGDLKWYTLLGGHLEHSDHYITNHFQTGPNISTGLFYQGKTYSTELGAKTHHFLKEETHRDTIFWSNTWRYKTNISLGAELKSESYTDTPSHNTLTLKSAFFF